jgi:hypothetical protein
MKTSHKGMGINQEDYAAFKRHLAAKLEKFKVSERECNEVISFISGLEATSSRISHFPTERRAPRID